MHVDEGSRDESSESEADQGGPDGGMLEPAQAKAKPEVAHLGMQPKKALVSQRTSGFGHERLSIAEQERLALDMLARTR